MSNPVVAARFAGRCVVVTGAGGDGASASRGAARAAAAAFAAEGARVVVGDASTAADVERLIGGAITECGRLDTLVWASGPRSEWEVDITEIDPWRFTELLDLNLKAAYLTARHAVPHLLKTGGSLVFIVSDEALPGNRGTAGAVASSAVLTLMKCIVYQYGPRGVRANALIPGLVNLAGQRGSDEDAAGLALFLASDEASYMTGAVLGVEQPAGFTPTR